MLGGGARFELACRYCALRLVVDRIRAADAEAMIDHMGDQHPELRLPTPATLGDVLDHFRVKAPRS